MNDLEQNIRQRVAMTIGMQANRAMYEVGDRLLSEPEAPLPSPEQQAPPPVANARRERSRTPGALAGSWRNTYLAAAMPVLLLVERMRSEYGAAATDWRGLLALELTAFQRKLTDAVKPTTAIARASYLLCTYVDEVVVDMGRDGRTGGTIADASRSLLVDFHGDAWGGEDCFADLEGYLAESQKDVELLELYELVLELGLKGRFRMVDQGHIVLENLRARLRAALGSDGLECSLAILAPAGPPPHRRLVTPMRLLVGGLLLCAAIYGGASWHLHERGLPTRQAILAWEPPVRPPRIDIQATLPSALDELVAEGWLEAIRQPYGWLLLFTSDNAFESARAELNAEYEHNISRLGRVLADWPGELEVVGHTDAQPVKSGRFADNQALSVARAQSVQRILRDFANVRQPARPIGAIGKGDLDPIADDATDAGRRRNRRVDIRWKITNPTRHDARTRTESMSP